MPEDVQPVELEVYPQHKAFVTPLGLTVRTKILPGVLLSQDIDRETMHQIVKRWLELYPGLGETATIEENHGRT